MTQLHDAYQPGVVVVLGLSAETSEREVVEYLQNFCRVRHCAIKSKGSANYFAFVEFASRDGVDTVLHHAPHMIALRPVRVVRAFKQVKAAELPFPGMSSNPTDPLEGTAFDPSINPAFVPPFSLFASASPLFAR